MKEQSLQGDNSVCFHLHWKIFYTMETLYEFSAFSHANSDFSLLLDSLPLFNRTHLAAEGNVGLSGDISHSFF